MQVITEATPALAALQALTANLMTSSANQGQDVSLKAALSNTEAASPRSP